MCGILGCIQTQARLTTTQFDTMLDTLTQRGPDGRGVKSLDDGRVLLGHRRLSIIDLSAAGAQPMTNEDGSIWLTFNGEIYNYQALREELSRLGHVFASRSDSEVIIHAYEQWGQACLQRFRGIFAFGIWDTKRRTLLLARDPHGVKPLYYAEYGGTFSFASQPKAIISDPAFPRNLSISGLSSFLSFGYVPHNQAIFDNMHKLPAGHFAVLKDGTLSVSAYTEAPSERQYTRFADATAAIDAALADAVNVQLVSDVPVGCYLSGGIDSSLLTALAAPAHPGLRSFTIGFNEAASDERAFARVVANRFGTEHFEGMVTRRGLEDALWDQQEHFDEPFDPISTLPSLEVARLARSNATVVTLGGDGADELFTGYLRYDDFDRSAHATFGRRAHKALRHWGLRGSRPGEPGDLARMFRYEGCLAQAEQHRLFCDEHSRHLGPDEQAVMRPFYAADLEAVVAAQRVDLRLFLVDHVLCKVDRASMAHGVEARVPFLDPAVVSAAMSVPLSCNYRRGERKAVLKAVARRYLPDSVVTSRKKGFSSPLWEWADPQFVRWADAVIANGYLVGSGVINRNWREALSIFPQHADTGSRAGLLILTAELWARRWIVGEPVRPTLSAADTHGQ